VTPTVIARLDEITREEWLKLRTGGIGGSDAAAVCGLDPWSSPFAVYQSKVAPTVDEDNDAMMWGRKLEGVVADHFAEEHPELSVGDYREMYAHPDRPWQMATPDRVVHLGDDPGILEVKTTSWRHADQWADGKVPDRAAIQTHHYLEVMGFEWAWVVVLIDGRTYLERRLERDPDLAERLTRIEASFWTDHVETQTPPPIDGSRSTADALAALYDSPAADEVELDLDAVMALDELVGVKEQIKALNDQKTACENRIKAALGDHEIGTVEGAVAATWKRIDECEVPATVRKAYRRLHVSKGKP
jgi:putative phage-type endonuclease